MFNVSRSTGLYFLLLCGGLLPTSQAHAFDLNGAWATVADQCSKIFIKKGDKISFAPFSEEFGRGFVADGNNVRSKTERLHHHVEERDWRHHRFSGRMRLGNHGDEQ